MLCRLAILTLFGVLSACDAPPSVKEPAPPRPAEIPAAPQRSKQQADELSAQCGKMASEQFQRAWKDGNEITAEGQSTAEFAFHYNTKLNVCFYLLNVSSPGNFKKMLFDLNGGELYGEYHGPAVSRPKACRMESLYCASAQEWEVLAEPYMKD